MAGKERRFQAPGQEELPGSLPRVPWKKVL